MGQSTSVDAVPRVHMPDTARCNLLASLDGHLEKLREAILDMAIRGALVLEGRPGPGPLAADPDGDAFSLPVGWKWVFAENVFSSIADGDHQAPPKSDDGVPFLVIGNVCKGVLDFAETRFVSPAYFSKLLDSRRPQRGDLLYTVVGSFGIPVVVDSKQPFCVQRHIAILRPSESLDVRYAAHLFRSPFVYGQANTCATGTAQKTVSLGTLRKFRLPLPPLAEQKRIVAKVDQLMALCDDLEAKQTKKRDLATQSTRSALTALTTAETAEDLAAAWRRIQAHFENFVSRPDDVVLLRQASIELAVRGRLVGTTPSDGSGQDLLRKIREENQKAGKAKNTRQGEANVTEAAQPFQIPSHWAWVCWRDLFQSSEAGWSPQCASRPRVSDEWGVLKVSAVSWDQFDPDENKALLPGVEPRRDYAVQVGDFLMSRANTAALVGRSVVVAQQPTRLLMSDKTIRCHFSPLVDRSFMNYYNRTETARQHYVANASGTSDSMKNISRDVILDMPAPLPPLAEQKRIVAKLDQLMSLLDDLEAKLRKQEETATRLAESLAAVVAA